MPKKANLTYQQFVSEYSKVYPGPQFQQRAGAAWKRYKKGNNQKGGAEEDINLVLGMSLFKGNMMRISKVLKGMSISELASLKKEMKKKPDTDFNKTILKMIDSEQDEKMSQGFSKKVDPESKIKARQVLEECFNAPSIYYQLCMDQKKLLEQIPKDHPNYLRFQKTNDMCFGAFADFFLGRKKLAAASSRSSFINGEPVPCPNIGGSRYCGLNSTEWYKLSKLLEEVTECKEGCCPSAANFVQDIGAFRGISCATINKAIVAHTQFRNQMQKDALISYTKVPTRVRSAPPSRSHTPRNSLRTSDYRDYRNGSFIDETGKWRAASA